MTMKLVGGTSVMKAVPLPLTGPASDASRSLLTVLPVIGDGCVIECCFSGMSAGSRRYTLLRRGRAVGCSNLWYIHMYILRTEYWYWL